MVCGRLSIPWKKVVFAELTLHHTVMLLSKQTTSPRNYSVDHWIQIQQKLTDLVQNMVRTCRNSYHQIWPQDVGVKHNLIDRLVISSMNRSTRLEATLPQDYIFSVLAICADAQEAANAVEVDYSRSEVEVFINVAQYLLRHVGGPVLNFAGIDTAGELSLPSWVPNWSAALPRQPLCWRKDVFERENQDNIYVAPHAALEFDRAIASATLRIKAYEIDSIPRFGLRNDLFPTIYPDDLTAKPAWHHKWLASYKTFQQSVLADRTLALSGNALAGVLWRIPIADQDIDMVVNTTTRAPPTMSRMYDLIIGKTPPSSMMDLFTAVARYCRVMDFTAVNRMPFVTSNGRLGLGPRSMTNNDRVFMIPGQQTPFILRESGHGQYHVVGEAYIYGIMDGEYLVEDADFTATTLV